MLTYPWKCPVLHCNHLGNTWKPLVLMTWHFDYCLTASEGDNQSVRSLAPVVSRCFPGGYNVKLDISRGRLAWWLLTFLHSEICNFKLYGRSPVFCKFHWYFGLGNFDSAVGHVNPYIPPTACALKLPYSCFKLISKSTLLLSWIFPVKVGLASAWCQTIMSVTGKDLSTCGVHSFIISQFTSSTV